jgi:hypothetical protein
MKNYYCLLTRGYETEECYTPNEPFEKIEAYLNSYNLPYEQVFNKCDGKMQVIVYQYSTLYMETFIIHRTRDLQ